MCMSLYLGSLLCSVDLCIYFYATVMFTLLQLCKSLKSGSIMPSALFFFLKILSAIQDLQWFYTNFRIASSISVKNAIGTSMGTAQNLQIALSSADILAILISINQHEISFHFCIRSSISFINILQFFGIYIFHFLG